VDAMERGQIVLPIRWSGGKVVGKMEPVAAIIQFLPLATDACQN